MRMVLIVFLLIAAPRAWAQSPEEAYVAARVRTGAVLEEKSKTGGNAWDSAYDQAKSNLEAQLRRVMGPVPPPKGFSGAGTFSPDALCCGLGVGMLDGILFQSGSGSVLVTTESLLRLWLQEHKNWWKNDPLATDPKAALQSSTFYTQAISAEEMAQFASAHDFQLLAVDGVDTQYMWITMRKQPNGWFNGLAENPPRAEALIRKIVNSYSGEPIVPASGRFACMSLLIENLPAECDLNQMNIEMEGQQAAPIYIGAPVFDGVSQVNALLPPDVRSGLVPVDVLWFGEPLCEQAWARVIQPGPPVPRLTALSDGINLASGARITSRTVKLSFEELAAPDQLGVCVDGVAIPDLETFCTDPIKMRFEINFTLPDTIAKGAHTVEMRLGSRGFPAVGIEVC